MITLIWAEDKNGGIGIKNKLPWKIPRDSKFFKEQTQNSIVVMGRKTFEGIGRPLPNRENIVITKQKDYHPDGVTIFNSVEEVLNYVENKDTFVIGGSGIYEAFMEHADNIIQTKIMHEFEVDVYAPKIDLNIWNPDIALPGIKDDKNIYDYYFMFYQK